MVRARDHTNVYKYLKEGYKEEGDRFFSVVPGDGTEGHGNELKYRRFPPEHEETLLHCESDQALAQFFQGG